MRKILHTLTLLFFCSEAMSQTKIDLQKQVFELEQQLIPRGSKVENLTSFGIRAGFVQSNLYGEDLDALSIDGKSSSLNGFTVGVVVNSIIGRYFWLKHELSFNHHGANVKLNDKTQAGFSSTLKMNSLQLLPASPAFYYKGFQLYAGPYVSALLNASILRKDEKGNYYKDKSIYGSAEEDTEENKYLQKIDFGLTTGLEYQITFNISIAAHYIHGFIPIFDNANANESKQVSKIGIYNQGWGVSIGYLF